MCDINPNPEFKQFVERAVKRGNSSSTGNPEIYNVQKLNDTLYLAINREDGGVWKVHAPVGGDIWYQLTYGYALKLGE